MRIPLAEAVLTVAQDRLTEMVVLGKANVEIRITGDNACGC
jgi:hypothetical protein